MTTTIILIINLIYYTYLIFRIMTYQSFDLPNTPVHGKMG